MTIEINLLALIGVSVLAAYLVFVAFYKRDKYSRNQINALEKENREINNSVLELEKEIVLLRTEMKAKGGQVVTLNNLNKANQI